MSQHSETAEPSLPVDAPARAAHESTETVAWHESRVTGRRFSGSMAFEPHPRNVGAARRLLQEALLGSGARHLADPAVLLLSELATNAVVHVGTRVVVRVRATDRGLRLEVEDGGAQLPTRRHYSTTAGTGRGLQLLDELADRWGVDARVDGKTVWLEMGDPPRDGAAAHEGGGIHPRGDPVGTHTGTREVTLRRVPLLMHLAWQEHAATLLREYLLYVIGRDDDDDVLAKHAQASQAMSLLDHQLPPPPLPVGTDALMAAAVEPTLTADEVVLHIPDESVPHFATLDSLLRSAVDEARAGRLLSPPTQPEMAEMRQWICSEIARQAGGDPTATPWMARTDVRATLIDQAAPAATYAGLADADEPVLVTDDTNVIVAASPAAVDVLGYGTPDALLGRRVLVVVPSRYHQAHIAGTTLHATNGRDNLLGVQLRVPMVRADGTEIPVWLEVRPERLDTGHDVFVARFRPA